MVTTQHMPENDIDVPVHLKYGIFYFQIAGIYMSNGKHCRPRSDCDLCQHYLLRPICPILEILRYIYFLCMRTERIWSKCEGVQADLSLHDSNKPRDTFSLGVPSFEKGYPGSLKTNRILNLKIKFDLLNAFNEKLITEQAEKND